MAAVKFMVPTAGCSRTTTISASSDPHLAIAVLSVAPRHEPASSPRADVDGIPRHPGRILYLFTRCARRSMRDGSGVLAQIARQVHDGAPHRRACPFPLHFRA